MNATNIAALLAAVITCLAVYAAAKTEIADLSCPRGPMTTAKDRVTECRDGNGVCLSNTECLVTDTMLDVLRKTRRAAEAPLRAVLWRRAFICGVAIVIVLFTLVLQRVPTAVEIVGASFVCTMVNWATLCFWNRHFYEFVTRRIAKNVNEIRRRLARQRRAWQDAYVD
jgi:hypothetical protein